MVFYWSGYLRVGRTFKRKKGARGKFPCEAGRQTVPLLSKYSASSFDEAGGAHHGEGLQK